MVAVDDARFAVVTPETASVEVVNVIAGSSEVFVPKSPEIAKAMAAAHSRSAGPGVASGTQMVISGVAATSRGTMLLKISPFEIARGMTVLESDLTGTIKNHFVLPLSTDSMGAYVRPMHLSSLTNRIVSANAEGHIAVYERRALDSQ
ncbi:MAG TPA: hypothetical protein VN442_16775 [Bryobacteraceae bacterium]|nr:hypothetical protein [Bryobacteraceae bacterium]